MNEDLVRAAHRNMTAAFSALTPHLPRGFLERGDATVLAFTGSPIRHFNQVLPTDAPLAGAALEAAVGAARLRKVPWVLQIRAGIDDACIEAAHDLALAEERPYFLPAMVLTDMPSAEPPPAGLEIRTVTSPEQFAEYLGAGGASPDRTATWLGAGILADPDMTLLAGHVDGRAVASSLAYRTDELVGVYNVGVEEGFRRRGLGWALTLAAIRAGAEHGCTAAVLQSSQMGFSVYAAHGFRTVFDYRCFVDRDPRGRSHG